MSRRRKPASVSALPRRCVWYWDAPQMIESGRLYYRIEYADGTVCYCSFRGKRRAYWCGVLLNNLKGAVEVCEYPTRKEEVS